MRYSLQKNLDCAGKGSSEALQKGLSSEYNVHPKTHTLYRRPWLIITYKVTYKNNIDLASFAMQMVDPPQKQEKCSHLLLIRPTNCIKSLEPMPMIIVLTCFLFLPNCKFNFPVKVQFSLNVAIPKNLTPSDREWNASQPIFTTSDQHIVPLINGKIDYGETDQMNKRWKEEGNWLLIMSLCQMLCSFLYKNSAPIYILYVLKLYKNTKFCSYTYLYILQL